LPEPPNSPLEPAEPGVPEQESPALPAAEFRSFESASAEIAGGDEPRAAAEVRSEELHAEESCADELRAEESNSAPAGASAGKRGTPLRLVALGILASIAGLAVPGMGHVLLGRWGRGLLLFAMVGALAVTGYVLRGNMFDAHPHDVFHLLGFVSDASSGIFYLLGRRIEANGPNVSLAIGDYGTRFIAASGVVNLLCALDAYDIAIKAKR
jgi:hypothetical protein